MPAKITFSGPLFDEAARRNVGRDALKEEVIEKVAERWLRPGRRAGRRNNILERQDRQESNQQKLVISSTLRHPRQSGNSWRRKQYAIARSMVPRVLRAAARRAAQQLGGS